MKILLSENKLINFLIEEIINHNTYDGNSEKNPYCKVINKDIEYLENLINSNGRTMISIENGKEYITYELYSLANAIGIRYCLCRLIKDKKPYGAIYTKPLKLFKEKNY